jgi:hypothetical protein
MGHRTKVDLMSFTRLYYSVFMIWAFTIFTYAYRYDVEDNRNEVIQAVTNQVSCSLLTGKDCELETTFNAGLWFLSLIAVTNLINLLFTTMGTTRVTDSCSPLQSVDLIPNGAQVTWSFWGRLFACDTGEGPAKHCWSVISGRNLEEDDRGFELREYEDKS